MRVLQSPHQRGVSLLEAVIGLAVLAVIFAGIAMFLRSTSVNAQREALAMMQAREMSTLGRAAIEFARDNRETVVPEVNDVQVLTIPDLIAAGFLPSGFGARTAPNPPGQTPLLQGYFVSVRRDGSDSMDISALVATTGAPDPSTLSRLGIQVTQDDFTPFVREILRALGLHARGAMPAFADAGSTQGIGAFDGFTYPLSTYSFPPPSWAAPVLLVNVPELRAASGIDTAINTRRDNQWGECSIRQGSCPSPTTSLHTWASCSAGFGVIINTDVGTLLIQSETLSYDPRPGCGSPFGFCDPSISSSCGTGACARPGRSVGISLGFGDAQAFETARLSGAVVQTRACGTSYLVSSCPPGFESPNCPISGFQSNPTPANFSLCCAPRP